MEKDIPRNIILVGYTKLIEKLLKSAGMFRNIESLSMKWLH